MQTKRENHSTILQDVWITYFCWSNRKITRMGQTSRGNFIVFLRHARTCSQNAWNGFANWRILRQINYTRFPVLVWTITKLKWKSWKTKVNCQKFVSILWLQCLYLARIGRPDILWSVNKLARSDHKMEQDACDRRLARLISYTPHTSDHRQYCHVGNAAQHCRLKLFKHSDFTGNLEDSKSTSGGVLCIFGSRTFVPIRWMCKKQTSVSHSYTESDKILLDAGLRMDGLLAVDMWDLVIEVLGTTHRIPKPTQACMRETDAEIQSTPKIKHVLDQKVDLSSVDQVPSNAHLSEKESKMYIFEDNEAVIKMITKCRSPTKRHVSRTHRVVLDRLFDRINLEPKSPNQVCRIQKPTRRHSYKKSISHVMSGTTCWFF